MLNKEKFITNYVINNDGVESTKEFIKEYLMYYREFPTQEYLSYFRLCINLYLKLNANYEEDNYFKMLNLGEVFEDE